jgi:hypothetical protein
LYEVDILITGVKSLSSRNGMFGRSAGAALTGILRAKIAWPSAGCFNTSAPAMVCMAPGRFSTITFQPSVSDTSVAMTRLMMSGGVAGAVGTTMVMTLDGNGCAAAS